MSIENRKSQGREVLGLIKLALLGTKDEIVDKGIELGRAARQEHLERKKKRTMLNSGAGTTIEATAEIVDEPAQRRSPSR